MITDSKKPTGAKGLFSSLLLSFFCIFLGQAQTDDHIAFIKASYDQDKLATIISDLKLEQASLQDKIKATSISKLWKQIGKQQDGTMISLQEMGTDGSLLYYTTLNDPARQTSRAHTLYSNGILDLGLDGTGLTVGVWDAGIALITHQEYGGRVSDGDASMEIDDHATMVTGNMISSGINSKARGAAYGAHAITHNWTRDKIEVAEAAANGLLLSNHSYGIMSDRVPDWYFGAYIKVAQDWDKIMYHAPYYLMVTAAGNAQRSMDNESPIYGKTSDGLDLLLGFATSKNGLTIAGANTEIGSQGELKSANIASYSSLGPVDDGRVKPDLAGDGNSILTTTADSDSSYASSFGTSMAAPGVTGSLLLLQQYHEELFGGYMKAATLKGLALHTADDVDAKGPDYKMGWGIMNAKSAAELLQNRDYSSLILEESLTEGETFTMTINAREGEALMASISWTDPDGEYFNRGDLNSSTSALTNDLDIRISKNGTTVFPWKLNPKKALDAAIQGDNLVDPYERIEIANASGEYTITISHKGLLKDGFQDFSLIVSGAKVSACETLAPDGLELVQSDAEGVEVVWSDAEETLFELQYKTYSTTEWSTEILWENRMRLSNLVLGEVYQVRLRAICAENAVSEFSDELQFEFQGADTEAFAYEPFAQSDGLQIAIFPNPAVDHIKVEANLSEDAIYSIVTTAGNIIKSGKARGGIDVSCLASGLYVLVVQDHLGLKSTKFYKS
nr:S8 family serine peptidase [Allomuricauda sp.]